jgi:S-DNA-T family DNA segregation ATPase FtsK/SpoIIIE
VRTTFTVVAAHGAPGVDVLVDLSPRDTVGELTAALASALDGPPGRLWLSGVLLEPSHTVAESGIRRGSALSLVSSEPVTTLPAAALHVVSGPDAGLIVPLPSGSLALESPVLPGAGTNDVVVQTGPAGVVVSGLPNGPRAASTGELFAVGADLISVVPTDGPAAATTPGSELDVLVTRPPRLRPAPGTAELEQPAPPPAYEPRKLAILPLALPVLLGVVMAYALHNPLYLLFTLLSPLLGLSTWWSDRRTGRASAIRAELAHTEAVRALHEEIAQRLTDEAAARRTDCPDAAALLVTAQRPGQRVWERRRSDEDSLVLRLGTGAAAARSVRLRGADLPELTDVPLTVPLRDVGVLGLAGPLRPLARFLVGQAAVLHSPRDLQIWLLTDPDGDAATQDWSWLRWLPHTTPGPDHPATALVGIGLDDLTSRVTELVALVAARVTAASAVRSQLQARRQPDLLVVLDGARTLRTLPGLTAVLRDGPGVGVHVLCLDAQERLLPEECLAVATVADGVLTVRVSGDADQTGRPDLVSIGWAEQVARGLAPLRDATIEGGDVALPATARLLDVLGLEPPTPAAITARWGHTSKALLGVGADGPFVLDLKKDGPHTLVAGTTGAGKSELLQSLVATLAAANTPAAMTFVLVDYKGGAAFKDCARLPHTVGMVTDLDGHLVERALASLTAELKGREGLLARAGTKDVDDYWVAGSPGGPLPRLVIVIDEFASLIEELPDFVGGLVGIAQRGRSLGVHLVLATQRPSGVVSPEIRANTNLRIALRVTDPSESQDVLEVPDAATIPRNLPGRAVVRTGHGPVSTFQTARVGGRRPGAATRQVPIEVAVLPWSKVGSPAPPICHVVTEPDQDATDLHALVEAIGQAFVDSGETLPRRPWLDPLPETVTLSAVRREVGVPDPADRSRALAPIVFGIEDVPAEQRWRPAVLDLERGGHLLVAGAARSGRTTLLQTLAASLAHTVGPSDAHLYAVDCGNGALQSLTSLPHCGAVVTRGQTERAERLLTRLSAEVTRRQELMAARGVTDLAAQRESSADPLPYLVLLVDRWEGFTATFDEIDAGRATETLLRLLREGPGAGLRVVVTGDRSALLGKLNSLIEDVLVLRLADRSDYSLAGLTPRQVPTELPPGRALRPSGGTQVQVGLESAEDPPVITGPIGRRPFRVDVLPSRVTVLDAEALDASGPGVAVGVGGDELRRQTVRLEQDGPGFVISGPPRSGRSTALLAMAQALQAGGVDLVVLAPRPSPLRLLEGALLIAGADASAADIAAALNRADGRLAVIIDDAELVTDPDLDELLQQVVRGGRDSGHVLVAAGTTDDLLSSFRGFLVEARKCRTGLLLTPTSHLAGEVLGLRLPRSAAFSEPVGRGLLVRSGQSLLVQVPTDSGQRDAAGAEGGTTGPAASEQ